jgi:asparagine synthase (glutamine-hydrolysing)
LTEALKSQLCSPSFVEASGGHDSLRSILAAFTQSDAEAFVDACMNADITHYLSDCLLVKVDIASMAWSLEGRSPFLDHKVMEFAAGLPVDFKLRHGEGKYLLKQAVADLLPAEILNRRKMGFGVPLSHWFRGPLRGLACELLLDGRLAKRGWFDMPTVERLLREHVDGLRDWRHHLWNLVMLEQWARMFLDRRPTVSPTEGREGLDVIEAVG